MLLKIIDKRFLTLIALLCINCIIGQKFSTPSGHISGSYTINIEKQTIQAELIITNIDVSDPSQLILNDIFKIDYLQYNQNEIRIKKDKKNCYDCVGYKIDAVVTKKDTIKLKYSGRFNTPKKDYKGKISCQHKTLRASEQSKWLPVWHITNSKTPKTFSETLYTYDLSVNCNTCKGILIENQYYKSGNNTKQFTNTKGSKTIMLIAGDINYKKGKNAAFLNLNKNQIKYTDSLAGRIRTYYNTLVPQIELQNNFIVANCPSTTEWAFITYPVIVTTQNNYDDYYKSNKLIKTLSHEFGHYYFGGNILKANSPLFWFYTESFAEYLSLKFMNDSHYPKRYFNNFSDKINQSFINLKEIEHYNQIDGTYRYRIAPLLLLAIEKHIGEEKMTKFINHILQKAIKDPALVTNYEFFTTSLVESGVTKEQITYIENNGIIKFNPEFYKTAFQ
ncbi:hypothetical protein [Aquimarina sp. 2201CG5-10]|uniref:hypothetical protein n=1 Tax=Aquimarina callyspongiae TaxID=3098150 RepID=UPI002AB593C5|nr:hypothetical protein [Aquimarina sp. 2201CG5-10]MDY8138589.1 hypothetical protein [Aquimarina sp. 2201CG5-10]